MASVLIELWSGEATPTRYVLRAESVQHQITRAPTIITYPGDPSTGDPGIIGYDLGVIQETLTINGIIGTEDESITDSNDPAYEAGETKTYPGKISLRDAVRKWWHTVDWETSPPTGFCYIKTPLDESYEVVVQQCQFSLEPGHDYYHFSLVCKIAVYPEV